YGPDADPLEEVSTQGFTVVPVDVTKMTRESLADSGLTLKEIDRSKNMFVLGIVYWLYSRSLEPTINFLRTKFAKNPQVAEANVKAREDGYTFGAATQICTERYSVGPAKIEPGRYRNITGNEAAVIGLTAAAKMSGIPM